MSARHLIVLGTASQAPTRYRHHNGYVLRWDDRLLMFDPGEGTQRQCILAGVSIARLTAVCITHFHGDHCLGLPGVIQRRALDNRSAEVGLEPLPVLCPYEHEGYLENLRSASSFHDTSKVVPYEISGEYDGKVVCEWGPPDKPDVTDLTITARALDHRIVTFGYRVDEPDHTRLDPARLLARGISGPNVGKLLRERRIETPNGTVGLAEVSVRRPGQSFAFVMDTRWCDAALELADGADMLVCEATYLDRDAELAHDYHHMTALEAGRLAHEAGARRLVVTHFSARYTDTTEHGTEARTMHDDVVVAEELKTIPVPPRA